MSPRGCASALVLTLVMVVIYVTIIASLMAEADALLVP